MATYQQYPTPPSTSSPQHYADFQSQSQSQPQAYYHTEPSPLTQAKPVAGPHSQTPSALPKIASQDSYFHSNSAPGSPTHDTNPSQRPPKPYRRRSSPLLSGPGGIQYSQPGRPFTPPSSNRPTRPYSPVSLNRMSPKPLHFSPSNPAPSPYSAGRPQPRSGFLKRMAMQVQAWIQGFMKWSKKNPLLAGLLTFVPVMAVALILKIAKGLGRGMGLTDKGYARPANIGGRKSGMGGALGKALGGGKGGGFGGLLKMMQMLPK